MVNFLLDKKYKVYGTYRRKKISPYLPYLRNKNIKNFTNFKVDFDKKPKKILKIIKKVRPFVIIDFASICVVNQSWKYPETYINVNVLYKSHIFKNLSNFNFLKKYIYVSTPEVFGSTDKLIRENCSKFDPSTPYATSKLCSELLLKNYVKSFNAPVIIARFSNFFGLGQPAYRLIPKVITCIDKKIKFTLEGKGEAKRNYIYTYDFCNGIYKIVLKGINGRTYHFSGNKYYKTTDVIKMICKLKNYKFKNLVVSTKKRVGQDLAYKLHSQKTKTELNWRPKFSFRKAISEIISHNRFLVKKTSSKDLVYRDISFK